MKSQQFYEISKANLSRFIKDYESLDPNFRINYASEGNETSPVHLGFINKYRPMVFSIRYPDLKASGVDSGNTVRKNSAIQNNTYVSNQRKIKEALARRTIGSSGIDEENYFSLLINPQEMSQTFEAVYSDRAVRIGFNVNEWGQAQRRMTCRGKTPAFYLKDPYKESPHTGISRNGMTKSAAFANLMRLVQAFLNNGVVVDPNMFGKAVGDIQIIYDSKAYFGSFDSLNLREDSEDPFLLSYDFEYVISHEQDLIEIKNE